MAPEATKRYAVVTGANKGIGFEIVRQLGSNGITVVLGCRDEKRGLEAVEKLKGLGVSDVIFHQLDVTDSASIASFAEFIKAHLGKLDILVNNAGVMGVQVDDPEAARRSMQATGEERIKFNYNEIWLPTYEATSACFQVNYYGTTKTTEALLPLLQLSDSPRIVNISSTMGKLTAIPNEWAKGILSDTESLTEEKIDQVLNEFLKDFKEGTIEAKGWPTFMGAYIVSKAVVHGFTRILAKKYPTFRINSVCPGFVKTDLNQNSGHLTASEGAESPVRLALLPDDGPTGAFFDRKEISSFVE